MSHATRGCYIEENAAREPLYKMELRSSIPEEVAVRLAFTWEDSDYRDYKVESAKSERQVRGHGYYPVMYCPFRGKKKTYS